MADDYRPLRIDAEALGSYGLNRSAGYVIEDFLAELQGDSGRRKFREMRDNDPIIGAMLFAIQMMMRAVDWRVDAADDSTRAEEIRAWVEGMLFERMDHTWEDFVSEVCSMFPFGFAFFEPLWRQGEDGMWEVRAIPMRAQETIHEFEFDEATGDLLGAYQDTLNDPSVYIPIERLIHFRTTTEKGNPEGRSILRNAYVAYERKKVVERAEGSQAIRTAGLVKMRLPKRIMDPDATAEERRVRQTFESAAQKIARDRHASVVLSSETDEAGNYLYDVEYVSTQASNTMDMGAIVERLDKRIAMTVLAQWMFLGQQGVGSFALSADQTAIFSNALKAWLGMIRAEINRRLVPTIMAVNGIDREMMPRLEHGDVETPEVEAYANAMARLATSGVLTPDLAVENAARQRLSIEERSEKDDERLFGIGGDRGAEGRAATMAAGDDDTIPKGVAPEGDDD